MHKFEPVYECSEIIETKTMAERKSVMEKNTDAFIVVSVGIGTFDEFFQILTLKEIVAVLSIMTGNKKQQ